MSRWYYTQIRKTLTTRSYYMGAGDSIKSRKIVDAQGYVSEDIPPIVLGHFIKEAALKFQELYGEHYEKVEFEIAFAWEVTEEEGEKIMALQKDIKDQLDARREKAKLDLAMKISNDYAERDYNRKQKWWYKLFVEGVWP